MIWSSGGIKLRRVNCCKASIRKLVDFELWNPVSPAVRLFVSWNSKLFGSDLVTQLHQSSELRWYFSLIQSFDVLAKQRCVLNCVELLKEIFFGSLPLVKEMQLSIPG